MTGAREPSGRPIRVALVVGGCLDTAGAAHCGVRDYARTLSGALCDAGLEARVTAPRRWRLRDFAPFVRAVKASRTDIVHLQYPSLGHRGSLLPHALGLAGIAPSFVATLHEHSALPRPQRLANQLFRASAKRIIFTTPFEARRYGAPQNAPIIPIGSNIPAHSERLGRDQTVLYFGQVRPNKGLEAFIALAELCAKQGEAFRFRVIGSTPPRWTDYRRQLRASAPVDLAWSEGLAYAEVAAAMAVSMVAFLPFPDGAGERRGSLLAALANGLPVISTIGPATTAELKAALLPADGPDAALAQLRTLRANPDVGLQLSALGRSLASRFSWARIASAHATLYRDLLRRPFTGGGRSGGADHLRAAG